MPPPGYSVTGWHAQQTFKYNLVPTKYVRTRAHSKLKWIIARSHETYLEVAFNVGGDKYAGGARYASKTQSSISWAPEAGNGKQQIFYIKWRYQRERKFCHDSLGTGHVWMLNSWRWLPNRAETGNDMINTTVDITCGGTGPAYVDHISSPVEVSTGTSAGYAGFFTIIGVSLDLTQQDRTSQIFTVTPDPGEGGADYRGTDGTPGYATFVKEMVS